MKIVLRLVIVLFLISLLASCNTYQSKADYFDGSAMVEYYQTMSRGSDDTLTFTFNEDGQYDIEFSYTEGYENNRHNRRATLPENFTITVDGSQKSIVVSQYVLPGYLTVSITHGEITESHDFK